MMRTFLRLGMAGTAALLIALILASAIRGPHPPDNAAGAWCTSDTDQVRITIVQQIDPGIAGGVLDGTLEFSHGQPQHLTGGIDGSGRVRLAAVPGTPAPFTLQGQLLAKDNLQLGILDSEGDTTDGLYFHPCEA